MISFADPFYHHDDLFKLLHADVFHTVNHITASLCVITASCLLQCHVCWTSFNTQKGQGGFKDDQCDPPPPQFGTEYTKVLPDGCIINQANHG